MQSTRSIATRRHRPREAEDGDIAGRLRGTVLLRRRALSHAGTVRKLQSLPLRRLPQDPRGGVRLVHRRGKAAIPLPAGRGRNRLVRDRDRNEAKLLQNLRLDAHVHLDERAGQHLRGDRHPRHAPSSQARLPHLHPQQGPLARSARRAAAAPGVRGPGVLTLRAYARSQRPRAMAAAANGIATTITVWTSLIRTKSAAQPVSIGDTFRRATRQRMKAVMGQISSAKTSANSPILIQKNPLYK